MKKYKVNLESLKKAPVGSRVYWWEVYRPIRECMIDQIDREILLRAQHFMKDKHANQTMP